MKHTKSLTQIGAVHSHLPGEEETRSRLSNARKFVCKWLFESNERSTVDQEWPDEYVRDAAKMAIVYRHLPGEEETDNKFRVMFEQEQKDRIKWQEEAKKWETLFDKLHDAIVSEIRRDSVGPTEEPEACIKRIIQERDQLKAQLDAAQKQLKEDIDYQNDLAKQLCTMEDALGFKNDCTDKDGAFVPTIGPWLERVRDLIATEGEVGDLRARLADLRRYIDQAAKDADKSSKEWGSNPASKEQAAYRSGMWYSYNDVRNRLPL